MAMSSWESHCKSSATSSDDCRTVLGSHAKYTN